MANDISFTLDKLQLDLLRQKAERALLEREEKLAVTLHSIGDAVISTDIHGLIQQMNPVAEYLTGWNEKAATGQPLDTVFHIIDARTRAPTANPVTAVLQHGDIVGLALPFTHKKHLYKIYRLLHASRHEHTKPNQTEAVHSNRHRIHQALA